MIQTTPTMSLSTTIFALVGRLFRYSQVTDRDQPGFGGGPGLNMEGERPDYGAYNEAFIVHQWASFGPRF